MNLCRAILAFFFLATASCALAVSVTCINGECTVEGDISGCIMEQIEGGVSLICENNGGGGAVPPNINVPDINVPDINIPDINIPQIPSGGDIPDLGNIPNLDNIPNVNDIIGDITDKIDVNAGDIDIDAILGDVGNKIDSIIESFGFLEASEAKELVSEVRKTNRQQIRVLKKALRQVSRFERRAIRRMAREAKRME